MEDGSVHAAIPGRKNANTAARTAYFCFAFIILSSAVPQLVAVARLCPALRSPRSAWLATYSTMVEIGNAFRTLFRAHPGREFSMVDDNV